MNKNTPLFIVTLSKCGRSKLRTFKAVRQTAKISLKDAICVIENPPAILGETTSEQEASEVKKEIEATAPGAEVTIDRIDNIR